LFLDHLIPHHVNARDHGHGHDRGRDRGRGHDHGHDHGHDRGHDVDLIIDQVSYVIQDFQSYILHKTLKTIILKLFI
jgi:hypothetical protein